MRESALQPTTRTAHLALAVLVVCALALRITALDRLLPHAPEPDAFIVQHAQSLRGDAALQEHSDFAERYPSLLAHALALFPTPRADDELTDDALVSSHLAAASRPYVEGRALALVLSMLLVPLTWLVARRFMPPLAAWLAAAFVATSLLHALFSTEARPHGPVAAFSLFAVLIAMRMAERPTLARTAAAGIAAALAIACLQTGFFTLPPLVLAGWLAGGTSRARATRAIWPSILALALALPWYPRLPTIDAHGVHLAGVGSHDIDFAQFDGTGLAVAAHWAWSHDPELLVLALVGAALALTRVPSTWRAARRGGAQHACIALAHALPYLVLTALNRETYERFLLPLLPWAAITAAFLFEIVTRKLPIAVRVGIALAGLAFPGFVIARFAVVSTRMDSMQIASACLEAVPDAETAIILVSPGLALPVAYEREALAADVADASGQATPWTAYQRSVGGIGSSAPSLRVRIVPASVAMGRPQAPTIDELLAGLKPTYVVLERTSKNRFLAASRTLRAIAESRGELVLRTPGVALETEELGTMYYQGIERFVPRLLAAERFGAEIEIWRLVR